MKDIKFLIITLVILLISQKSFSQSVDSDGDGVTDVEENKIHSNEIGFESYFNPFIADIPSVSLTFNGAVDIGIEYMRQNKIEELAEFKQEVNESKENLDYKLTYNSRSMKNQTEINVSGGFSASKFFGGFEIKNNFKSDAASGIELRREETEKWKKQYTAIQNKIESGSISFDGTSGYIRASLKIFNPSKSHKVKISNIVFNAYAYNVYTGVKDNIPLFQTRVASIYPLGSSVIENSVELERNEKKDRLIEIKQLNSNSIIELLQSGKSIVFEIEEYTVEVLDDLLGSRIINSKSQSNSLWRNTFALRIINDDEDVTYYIAKKDANGNYINLKQALGYLYPSGKVEYSNTSISDKTIDYIYRINNKISNLPIKINPTNYTSENLQQGFWFKLIKEGTNYSGDISSQINEPGVDISLVYLKGLDLKVEEKKEKKIVGQCEDEIISTDLDTKLTVNGGDILRLEIEGFKTQYSVSNSPHSISIYCPGYSFPHVYYSNSIDSVWKKIIYTKQQIKKVNLYFKFGDLETLYRLSDFDIFTQQFVNPNKWILEFELPKELKSHINYRVIVKSIENSIYSNPIIFRCGTIGSETDRLRNYPAYNQLQCPIYFDLVNELREYDLTKVPITKYKLNIIQKR